MTPSIPRKGNPVAVLRVDSFEGLRPIVDARKLSNGGATVAKGTRLDATDLRPFQSTQPTITGFGFSDGANSLTNGTAVDRLYKFTSTVSNIVSQNWLPWSTNGERVDPVPSPIPFDSFNRLYWTRQSTDGTRGLPMVCSNPGFSDTLASPGAGNAHQLGIPAPTLAPTIAPQNTPLTATIFGITNAAPAQVQFSSAPAFTTGQQVLITIPPVTAGVISGMTELSGKQFLIDPVANSTTLFTLRGSDTSHMTAWAGQSGSKVSVVYTDSDFETRSYVYTIISLFGEEGPPSPPSTPSNVLLANGDGIANVTMNYTRPPWDAGSIMVKARLYRTLAGSTGTNFYFVADVPFSGGGGGSGPVTFAPTTFIDNVKSIALAEQLPSTNWTAPPLGMFGLTVMPNGFMIGFKGNTIYACEAYQPHAWPNAYTKTTDYYIVGAATFGQTAVIATTGRPYMLNGSDPASLTLQQIELDAPCIGIGGCISVGNGVAYPTFEGMAVIGAAGAQIVTQDIMSKADWLAVWDTTMTAAFHEGTYYAFSKNLSKPSFALRMVNGSKQFFYISSTSAPGTAPAVNTLDDTMYYCAPGGNAGAYNQLTQWDGSTGNFANYLWQSKIFTLPEPVNFAVVQVFATTYPVTLTLFASKDPTVMPATETFQNSVVPVSSPMSIVSPEPVRLPSGFTAREWQMQLAGNVRVQSVVLATSMAELRQE